MSARRVRRVSVSKKAAVGTVRPSLPGPRASDRGEAVHARGDASSARAARDRRRTSRPSRRAAPAPCRCWTSPSRGGCAARASAARAETRAAPSASTVTPTRRPGSVRLNVVARGQEGRVRAAETHRHAEALGRADDDVGAPFARRRQQRQREQVGGDDDQAHRPHAYARPARDSRRRRRCCPGIAARTAKASAAARLDAATPRPPRCRAARRACADVDASAGDTSSATNSVRLADSLMPQAQASSLRRPRSPRRASTRWRSACRSGRRPWSGS